MLKKIKNRRKIIIKNIKIKDPLIGYAIDAIIWTILSELFVIYVTCQKAKMCSIILLWEIAINMLNYYSC